MSDDATPSDASAPDTSTTVVPGSDATRADAPGPDSRISHTPNVLQVCTFYYPYTGGIQRIVRTLVDGIDAADFLILTSRPRGRGGVDDEAGTRIVRVGSLGTVASTPVAPTFPYRLRQQLAWADLVHYHLPFPLGPASHLLNRAGDTPTVVTFHDDIVGKGPVAYPYQPVFDRFMRGVDRMIVTSPTMREETERIAPYREKTEVVPIGVDDVAIDADATPKPLDGRALLFVGRLVPFKGVDQLVAAMADLDATLSIVGTGPERAALERRAQREGVADRVTFEGFVPQERLDGLYREANAFVLPSTGRNESFGIVQLEAMQRGLPVINTDLPTGVPDVSVDGETGITVPPGEPERIAEAVEALFADPERYRRFSAAAQRRVRDRFTEARMLEHTAAIYRDVLAGE